MSELTETIVRHSQTTISITYMIKNRAPGQSPAEQGRDLGTTRDLETKHLPEKLAWPLETSSWFSFPSDRLQFPSVENWGKGQICVPCSIIRSLFYFVIFRVSVISIVEVVTNKQINKQTNKKLHAFVKGLKLETSNYFSPYDRSLSAQPISERKAQSTKKAHKPLRTSWISQ